MGGIKLGSVDARTMKLFFLILFLCLSLSISAQDFYLDIGMGIGKAWTKVDREDITEKLSDYKDSSIELGLKFGAGPLGEIPIYLVGEFSGIGHGVYNYVNKTFIQFNSFLIGHGLIIYPLSFLQLASSFGVSWASNSSSYSIFPSDSGIGFAWNISTAIDLGKNSHGLLIGVKYTYTDNRLVIDRIKQTTSMIGIFVKYVFRKKQALVS